MPSITEILSAYKADISMDYQAELFKRTRKFFKITGVCGYMVELPVFIYITKHLKSVYSKKT